MNAMQDPASQQSSETKENAPAKNVEVAPSDVVVAGCGVVTTAALLAAYQTYKSGEKSLLEDGINPNNRLRMIPVAVKTLMLSTVFTGILGTAGFYVLKSAGFFSSDVAELPSAKEAARMLRNPKAYWQQMVDKEKQQQQQQPGT